MLAGLGSVDAIAVFDGDTPAELLTRLRPDVWVKGGDYSAEGLPRRRCCAAGAARRWSCRTWTAAPPPCWRAARPGRRSARRD
ncbi:hypothetical protein [Streptomyces somaliensis]|uniref:hypothetical protein n=1 Tax=Streptomyces somaliensis TaxID=78355 RepID=UPI0034E989B6|nr:hypothetical protein [Streptomyces somaliensis]